MGIWQVVTFLMSISGFGVQKDAAAPAASEVLKYAPDDAEMMFYVDASSLIPGNYDLFSKLPNDPGIKAIPDAQQGIAELVAQAEQGRQMVKGMTGVDLVTDLKSIAGFASPNGNMNQPPSFLVVVRGNFPKDLLDKVAKADPKMHTASKIDGRTFLTAPDGHAAVGMAADGTVLFGTPAWVKARVANSYKSKPPAGSLADRATATLDGKPFFFIGMHFNAASQTAIDGQLPPEAGFVKDILDGQDFSSLALYNDGVGWTYSARSAAGYQRAIMASDGIIMIMRSAHLFTRGAAELLASALDSYAKDPTVAQLVAHKQDLLKLVSTWSGDGQFAANWDKNDSQNRLGVRLTGKSLADVVPILGLAVPAGAVALLAKGGKEEAMPMPATPVTAVPAPMPVTPVSPRAH